MLEPPIPSVVVASPRRYGRTLVAWLIGTLTLPIASLIAIYSWTASRCAPDSVDCSWGFEFLLAIPVYGFCLLVVGPLAVYVALRRVRDPLAARTAWWSLAFVVPSTLLVFVWVLPPSLIPPLLGRFIAMRKRPKAG